jgi:uncharacterized membrane protein
MNGTRNIPSDTTQKREFLAIVLIYINSVAWISILMQTSMTQSMGARLIFANYLNTTTYNMKILSLGTVKIAKGIIISFSFTARRPSSG